MEVTIKHLENVKFSIRARTHTIFCDQPALNGGEDSAMTASELLLASVGSCTAFYAVEYLKARNLEHSGVEVRVSAQKLIHPGRLDNFHVHITHPTALTEEQNEGLMRSVTHSLIHNTFQAEPEITIDLAPAETPAIAG